MSAVWNVVYLGNPKPIRNLVYDEIIFMKEPAKMRKSGIPRWIFHNIQKYQRRKAQSEMYVKGKQKQQKKVNPK